MHRFLAIVIAITTVAATALPASAGDWRRHHAPRYDSSVTIIVQPHRVHRPRPLMRYGHRFGHRHRPHVHRDHSAATVGAGAIGFAAGMIAGGIIASQSPQCVWIDEDTRRCN